MSRRENNPADYEDTPEISIDMGETKTAVAPAIMETTGLGPCIGIIVYDKKLKKGTVAHYPHPNDEIAQLITEVDQQYPNKKNLSAWVGGGGPQYDIAKVTETDVQNL